MNQQITIYTTQDGQAQLTVAMDRDTVWLSQAQMGELFDTTPENVLMHLKNIFRDEELAEEATAKEFLVVRDEGQRKERRRIKHYNLDAIPQKQSLQGARLEHGFSRSSDVSIFLVFFDRFLRRVESIDTAVEVVRHVPRAVSAQMRNELEPA